MIDKSRVAVAGHSMGGASAISAMTGDRRVLAEINLDGAVHDPVPAAGLGGRPFLLLGNDDSHRPGGTDPTWGETWRRLDGWKRWLTVTGSDHLSFSDFPRKSGSTPCAEIGRRRGQPGYLGRCRPPTTTVTQQRTPH